MFLLTFTVVNMAPTRQRLENDVFTVGGIAQKYNCALKRLDWQQEQGFVSSLALGYNEVEIQRGMTTSSTAIFIPFMNNPAFRALIYDELADAYCEQMEALLEGGVDALLIRLQKWHWYGILQRLLSMPSFLPLLQ